MTMNKEVHCILGRYSDTVALADMEGVQRVINHYIAEGFVVDFCHDADGLFGFSFNPTCFADRAEREAFEQEGAA